MKSENVRDSVRIIIYQYVINLDHDTLIRKSDENNGAVALSSFVNDNRTWRTLHGFSY